MRRIMTLAVAALALTATACASGNPQAHTNQTTPENGNIILNVTNHNFNAVVVRALTGGEDFRLGTVETDRHARLVVPPTINRSDLRFEVDAIGSGQSYVTPLITVNFGAVLDMNVMQELDLTNVTVVSSP